MSVEEILKKELIGKQLRYRKFSRNIIEYYSEYVKKSNNVTNAQFESGNPKFRMLANRQKVIGKHEIFDVGTISSLEIFGNDYHGMFIRLRFNNGDFIDKELYENIETL
jgi:hypothetical protein